MHRLQLFFGRTGKTLYYCGNLNPRKIKTSTLVGFTAVGLIAYNLVAKARALGSINFYPGRIVNLQFDGMTPVMTLELLAQNTTGQQMVLRSIAGNVVANGYIVGNISSFTPSPIRANSQSSLLVQLRLFPLGIVNDIIRAFELGNFHQDITIQAYANVDNYQIPIKLKSEKDTRGKRKEERNEKRETLRIKNSKLRIKNA